MSMIINAQQREDTTMLSSDTENNFSNMLIFSNSKEYYIAIKAMNLQLSLYLSTNSAGIQTNISNNTVLYNTYQSTIDNGILSILISKISNATTYVTDATKYINELSNHIDNLQTALNNLQISNNGFLPSNPITTSCQSNIGIAVNLISNI